MLDLAQIAQGIKANLRRLALSDYRRKSKLVEQRRRQRWIYLHAVHLNYAETILPMKDGLPKLKDFPAEIGGSGKTLAE